MQVITGLWQRRTIRGVVIMGDAMLKWLLFGGMALSVGAVLGQGGSPAEVVTFNKDIAPILAKKCIGCHYESGPAPFKLTSYKDARKRADLLETVAIQYKMPPTIAESDLGPIPLHQRLTDSEVRLIQEWVLGGAVEGAGEPVALKPTVQAWKMGPPDLILKPTGEVRVPAEGGTWKKMFHFYLPPDAPREIVAFDVRPTTPFAARQALVAVEAPGEQTTFLSTGLIATRLIGAWALGYQPWRLPENASVVLPKGEGLAVQMLYHPTGKAEDGSFELGLYFAKKPAANHPFWVSVGSKDFTITGDPRWTELDAEVRLDKRVQVISIQPEARSLAQQVWLRAKPAPDFGITLLHIFPWDARWSGAYNLPNPPILSPGTSLAATIEYDNSNHSDTGLTLTEIKLLPIKPPVRFGPRDTDELFWIHVQLLPVQP